MHSEATGPHCSMRAINPPCSHTQSFFLPPPALALFKAPRQHSSAPRMNEVAFTTGCLQPRCIGGDNWAPLSRRAFDLSLKTDVALLCLFQYALPSMGDAKGRRHLVIITQWFQLANPPLPYFKSRGLPIKAAVMASGAQLVTLKLERFWGACSSPSALGPLI